MKVGDLVRYGNERDYGVGVIIYVIDHMQTGIGMTCTVLWANGVESNHSSKWLVGIKETA